MTTPDPGAVEIGGALQTLADAWSGPNPRPEQARYRFLQVGRSHRDARRMTAFAIAVGMLLGLSAVATANNGLVIPFTGIVIGGGAGELPGGGPGTIHHSGEASLPPMSSRGCEVRDPERCQRSQAKADGSPPPAPGSGTGASFIVPAAPAPGAGGSGASGSAVPNDPLQSQGEGDGDGAGNGRNHPRTEPKPGG